MVQEKGKIPKGTLKSVLSCDILMLLMVCYIPIYLFDFIIKIQKMTKQYFII